MDALQHYSETTLSGESQFHINTPQGIWTWVPCDGKQTGSPLDQWDMVRMKWDCRLSPGLPPQQPTPLVVKPEGGPAVSVKAGQKSCVRSSGIITLSALGPSDGSGRSPPQMRPQKWSITLGSPKSHFILTMSSDQWVQWTTLLLPVTRDPGSKPLGGLMWNRDSPVSVVSLNWWPWRV